MSDSASSVSWPPLDWVFLPSEELICVSSTFLELHISSQLSIFQWQWTKPSLGIGLNGGRVATWRLGMNSLVERCPVPACWRRNGLWDRPLPHEVLGKWWGMVHWLLQAWCCTRAVAVGFSHWTWAPCLWQNSWHDVGCMLWCASWAVLHTGTQGTWWIPDFKKSSILSFTNFLALKFSKAWSSLCELLLLVRAAWANYSLSSTNRIAVEKQTGMSSGLSVSTRLSSVITRSLLPGKANKVMSDPRLGLQKLKVNI